MKTRFDIVEVLLRGEELAEVRHLPNAFEMQRPLPLSVGRLGSRSLMMFPRQEVNTGKLQPKRLQRHRIRMPQEIPTDAQKIGFGRDAADLVQELSVGSTPTPR